MLCFLWFRGNRRDMEMATISRLSPIVVPLLPLPTFVSYVENPPECAAGAAEGRGLTPGKPLRHGHDQGLRGEGIAVAKSQTKSLECLIRRLKK